MRDAAATITVEMCIGFPFSANGQIERTSKRRPRKKSAYRIFLSHPVGAVG